MKSACKIVLGLLSSKPTTSVRTWLSLVHVSSFFRHPKARIFVSRKLRRSYGVFLSPHCTYGKNFRIKHPVGVVIGSGVVIGENVTVFQNVTLGGRRMGDGGGDKYPSIGDGSIIFSGAVILGDVKIGKNAVVGANAVVLQNVPDDATAVGVPATIIQKKKIV